LKQQFLSPTYIRNAGDAVRNLSAKELSLLQAQSALEAAQQDYDQKNSELTTVSNELSLRQAEYNSAHQSTQDSLTNYNTLLNTYSTVYNNYLTKQYAFQTAQANLFSAQQNLDTAQYNYDNNLISDPTWTAPTQQVQHTRLVPHTETVATTTLVPHTTLVPTTTTSTTLTENILPGLDSTTWSGAGTGFQGSQPAINNGILKFSYMSQTVSYQTNASLSGTLPSALTFRTAMQTEVLKIPTRLNSSPTIPTTSRMAMQSITLQLDGTTGPLEP